MTREAQVQVPFFRPAEQDRQVAHNVGDALRRVLISGKYILGPEVQLFEEEAAALTRTSGAVAVSSGTDALLLMLQAMNIGKGHEVIVPVYTFAATAEAVIRCGAKPVFVDIEPETRLADPVQIARAITARTKALLAVSLFGLEPAWDVLESLCNSKSIMLLLDAAQSFGCGTLGEFPGRKPWLAAATSFFPTKPLGGLGDGGMVFSDNNEVIRRIKRLRVHGKDHEGAFTELGGNYRMDTLQAAALRAKLPTVGPHREHRKMAAARYADLFQSFEVPLNLITLPAGASDPGEVPGFHGFAYFVIQVARGRDELREHLQQQGIQTMIYYRRPLSVEPLFAEFRRLPPHVPFASMASNELLALPMHALITEEEQVKVVGAIAEWAREQKIGSGVELEL